MDLIPKRFQSDEDSDDQVEQLADADADPDPKGQHREQERSGDFGWLYSYSSSVASSDTVQTESALAPENIDEYWRKYYKEFALTRAPLKLFDEIVIEPGYRVRAEDSNGERDQDMEEALIEWASNCVIHGHETNEDLSVLLGNIPSKRRGKGTQFIEKVGTTNDPDALARLMMLKPSTMKVLSRQNQAILVHPDDAVDDDHLRTEDGDAAAYVQYHDELTTSADKDPIPFAKDDIIKLVYDADTGEAWGTSIYEAIDDRIDSLIQKLDDRDMSIRMAGYPHRIYSSDGWTKDQAKEFAKQHRKGKTSSSYGPDDDDNPNSFAGRVDFVPANGVSVAVESGSVPDISDAIMDDIQQIFSIMPVSRFKIAYEEDINQFVVEPQQDKDDLLVDSEQRYLERKFEPVFEQKADELAGGSYNGTIHFSIESPEDENPLKRENFPKENLESFISAWKDFKDGAVEQELPAAAFAEMMGFDLEELQEKYEWEPDPLEITDQEEADEFFEDDEDADEDDDDGDDDNEEDDDT